MITMSIFNIFGHNKISRIYAKRSLETFYLCGEHQLSESRIGPFILLSFQRNTWFNFEWSPKSRNSVALKDRLLETRY